MAKMKKKIVKGKAGRPKKKPTPPKLEPVEFGIAALAAAMDLEPASVRVKLRNAGVKKDGRQYDFKSASGVAKMAKQLAA